MASARGSYGAHGSDTDTRWSVLLIVASRRLLWFRGGYAAGFQFDIDGEGLVSLLRLDQAVNAIQLRILQMTIALGLRLVGRVDVEGEVASSMALEVDRQQAQARVGHQAKHTIRAGHVKMVE